MDHCFHNLDTCFLSDEPVFSINKDHVIALIYNMLCAVNFIHSAGVIHRDIKPSNILVDENCVVKICDFYNARSLKIDTSEKKKTVNVFM